MTTELSTQRASGLALQSFDDAFRFSKMVAASDFAPKVTYAVGDFVSGCSAGKRWQGRIWNVDGDRLSIEIDGGWLAVSAKDVTH